MGVRVPPELFMNKEEIYNIIAEFIPKSYYLARVTPDWTDEDRVTVLWVWAVENYNRYDPTKGNLTQWLKGCSRRIIDVYRKEKGPMREQSYPEIYDNDGELIDFAQTIPDYHNIHPRYDESVWALVQEALENLPPDSRWILESIAKRDSYKKSKGAEDALAFSLGVSKNVMRHRRIKAKEFVREYVERFKNGH